MTIAETLLAEFQQESRTTRKFLERLPEDKLNWSPHAKSMTAGQLALHIAESPGQIARMALEDEMPVPNFSRPRPQPESLPEILAAFDGSIASVTSILPTLTDEQMRATYPEA